MTVATASCFRRRLRPARRVVQLLQTRLPWPRARLDSLSQTAKSRYAVPDHRRSSGARARARRAPPGGADPALALRPHPASATEPAVATRSAATRGRSPLLAGCSPCLRVLVRGQQAGVDQRVQRSPPPCARVPPFRVASIEHREQLSRSRTARVPATSQVAEHLAHERNRARSRCRRARPRRAARAHRRHRRFPRYAWRVSSPSPDRASPTGERRRKRAAAGRPAPC